MEAICQIQFVTYTGPPDEPSLQRVRLVCPQLNLAVHLRITGGVVEPGATEYLATFIQEIAREIGVPR